MRLICGIQYESPDYLEVHPVTEYWGFSDGRILHITEVAGQEPNIEIFSEREAPVFFIRGSVAESLVTAAEVSTCKVSPAGERKQHDNPKSPMGQEPHDAISRAPATLKDGLLRKQDAGNTNPE